MPGGDEEDDNDGDDPGLWVVLKTQSGHQATPALQSPSQGGPASPTPPVTIFHCLFRGRQVELLPLSLWVLAVWRQICLDPGRNVYVVYRLVADKSRGG